MKRGISLVILVFIAFVRVSGQTSLTTCNDTTICLGGTATLSATVTSGSYGTASYTFQTIPYAPEPFSGGTAVCSAFTCSYVSNGKDDCVAGPFDIGFTFCFFSQNYTHFWIGSNGWISFSQPPGSDWDTFTATPIPNSGQFIPKNVIFFPWEDWYPCKNGGQTVNFYNVGTAPNRKLVVYWSASPFYNCANLFGTFQVVLNEQSSIIENNIQSKPLCGNEGATQGVQDSTGTIAFTATGRNDTPWSATNESTRFVPNSLTWYTGGYPGGTIVGYGTPINFSPTVTTTYTAVVQLCDASTATGNVTVTVISAAFTYPVNHYCQSDPNPTPVVVNSGGIFTSAPAGLVFVSNVTGTINLAASAPGIYTITYSITVPCTVSTSHNITINAPPPPPVPVTSYVSRCGQGSVTFGVTPQPGVTIKWYDAPTGGNLLFTGNSVTTNVNVTTHFYAESVTTATTCSSLTRTDVLVVVKPVPVITNTVLSYTVCSGDSIIITLLSSMFNSAFNWRAYSNSFTLSGYSNGSGPVIGQKLVNSGSVFDTVTYAVAATADTCTGDTVRFVVTVKPVFDAIANPASQLICSNTSFNIILTSSHPSTTFTWTATGSSPDVTGFSGGSGNLISQTLINSGTVNQVVTYKIVPFGNGCIGDTAISTVVVRPSPDLTNNPKNKSICNNTSTSLTLTSSIPGTLFTWTTTPSSFNVTGYSNNIIPTFLLNQTLVNTGFTTENVIYHITPHNNGCDGFMTDYTVNVIPVPDVLAVPSSQAICSGQQSNINLNSNVSGTTFSWTASGSSPAVTGYSSGSGSTIAQTISNSVYTIETVTYNITPSVSGCNGITTNYILTVFPVPDLANTPLTKQICSNVTTGIILTSDVPGTLFTWTCSPGSGNISGWSNNPIPAFNLNQILINSGTVNETVTYHITPLANGCTGLVSDYVVTVFPSPDMANNPPSKQICNTTPTNVTLTSNVPGTLFTWTANGSSGNVSGYSNNAVPVTIINQTLQNSGFAFETVTYHVIPHASGCSGMIKDFIVTVNPSPDAYFNPVAQSICSGQTTNIQILSHVPGSVFGWTASGSSANVSGYSAGNGNSIQQTLINSSYSIEAVTYQVSPASNGCPGNVNNVVITVDPLPVVLLSACLDSVTTTNAQPFKLKGGMPPGGSYSGAGVNAGIYYPGVAGPGGHIITYNLTNVFGCNGSSSLTIIVTVPMAFVCGNFLTDIRDNKQYPTIQIGTQCWIAMNLDYGLAIASSMMQRDNCVAEKFCFKDNPANCINYGALYQWDELMNYDNTPAVQGLCPPGWHIPVEAEWTTLFDVYISNGFAGSPLKSTGFSGFNAALDGIAFNNAHWNFNSFATMIWSSTPDGPRKAWAHGMNSINPSVSYYPSLRSNAFSVRCIKD